MKKKIESLIDLKSLITIALTIVFCILSFTGVIDVNNFMTIFVMVITYFFTRKGSNNNDNDSDRNNS